MIYSPSTALRLLGLLALVPACAHNPKPEPVYRYINILDGTKLWLGQPFPRRGIATQLDDTTFKLRSSSFSGGGTTSIVAHLDSAGILRSLTFSYSSQESLAGKVEFYTTHLGKPAMHQSAEDGSQLYLWQDDSTSFSLHYDPGRTPPLWSLMEDRHGS